MNYCKQRTLNKTRHVYRAQGLVHERRRYLHEEGNKHFLPRVCVAKVVAAVSTVVDTSIRALLLTCSISLK